MKPSRARARCLRRMQPDADRFLVASRCALVTALARAGGTFQGSIRLRHGCVTALACARGRNARAVTFFCSPVTASRARARCVKRIAQPECASLAHARTVPGTQLCIMPKVSLARARAYCSNNSARHRLGGSTVPRAGLSVRSTLRCASHNQGQIHHTPGTALAGSTCMRIVLISTSMGKP